VRVATRVFEGGMKERTMKTNMPSTLTPPRGEDLRSRVSGRRFWVYDLRCRLQGLGFCGKKSLCEARNRRAPRGTTNSHDYRVTSSTKKRTPLGPYSRPIFQGGAPQTRRGQRGRGCRPLLSSARAPASGTLLNFRTNAWQKCGAVPRMARIQSS
jgi:hypothetical protein